jgi:hypothetical protein
MVEKTSQKIGSHLAESDTESLWQWLMHPSKWTLMQRASLLVLVTVVLCGVLFDACGRKDNFLSYLFAVVSHIVVVAMAVVACIRRLFL